MGKIRFNDLHLHDLQGKKYEVFYPKKTFIEVRLNELQGFAPISKEQEFFDHWGVSYIMNSLIGLLHCTPNFTMDDILRQYDILDRRMKTKGTPIPQWVKDEILIDVASIINENLVEDTINEMLKDERAIKQVGLKRAWVIDPSIEVESAEYKDLRKKAKIQYTATKRVEQLKTILTNWDLEKQGQPTNENLAKYIDILEDTIKKYYSPLLKKEKAMAKKGLKKQEEPREREASLYYDDNGIGYNHDYLLRTNKKIYFPLIGKYTVTNYGEICKKNLKGEYKVMSVDKDGFCQLTIDGKRFKVNPTKVMVEVLFKEMTEPNREESGDSINLFSMDNEQLQENIKEHSDSSDKVYEKSQDNMSNVVYSKDQWEWMEQVRERKINQLTKTN